MSAAETTTQPLPRRTNNAHGSSKRGGGNRGRGNQGGRGRGGRGGKAPTTEVKEAVPEHKHGEEKVEKEAAVDGEDAGEDSDEAICWICAEPVKYYSVSECNHRTCHVCALRLRALYKKTDCTFCKEPQPSVVFTRSADAAYNTYELEAVTSKDAKLSIYFETLEMMEETLLLLRFNCPDPDCPYIGNGWGDLKLHCRASHGKLLCDLCVRNKKVFAHEHALYPPNILPLHLPSMYHRGGKTLPKDQIEGGIHPLCEFCRESFFGDDELFAHMRERHEECFICKRNGVRDQYFQNYESLENHFNRGHYPCTQSACQARKFVVFGSAIDLKAHMVDEHGADMSSRDKRDARRVVAEFEFEEVGRHGRQNRDRGHRDREREPPPSGQQPAVAATAQAVTQPTIARPGPGRRQATFGGNLTVEGGASAGGSVVPVAPASNSRTPDRSRPSTPSSGDMDPAVAERHAAFLTRLQTLTPNSPNAVPVVKAGIKGYRASESSARDLISTVWNVLDQNLESTASLINAVVDLLDQEDKKQELLASWKGFTLEQRKEFPDLVSTSSSNGGYAAITAGRVLNAKNATATRSSRRSSRQVWDRVAQAANSSSSAKPPPAPRPVNTFPALSSAGPPSQPTPGYRQPQRSTAWSAAAASGFRPTPPAATMQSVQVVPPKPRVAAGGGPSAPPPKLSNAAFPELPAAQARAKVPMSGNQSLKNILGTGSVPAGNAWGGSGGNGSNGDAATGGNGAEEGETEAITGATGKGKKGKGKQKQTLFTLGSFPN